MRNHPICLHPITFLSISENYQYNLISNYTTFFVLFIVILLLKLHTYESNFVIDVTIKEGNSFRGSTLKKRYFYEFHGTVLKKYFFKFFDVYRYSIFISFDKNYQNREISCFLLHIYEFFVTWNCTKVRNWKTVFIWGILVFLNLEFNLLKHD